MADSRLEAIYYVIMAGVVLYGINQTYGILTAKGLGFALILIVGLVGGTWVFLRLVESKEVNKMAPKKYGKY